MKCFIRNKSAPSRSLYESSGPANHRTLQQTQGLWFDNEARRRQLHVEAVSHFPLSTTSFFPHQGSVLHPPPPPLYMLVLVHYSLICILVLCTSNKSMTTNKACFNQVQTHSWIKQNEGKVSHLWVFREDVVHQSFVPRPERPTTTTNPWRRKEVERKEERKENDSIMNNSTQYI